MSVWTHLTVTFTLDNHQNIDPAHVNEVITKTSPKGSEGGFYGCYTKAPHASASGGYGSLVTSDKWGDYDDFVVESDYQLLFAYYGDFRDFGEEDEKALNDWFDGIVKWLDRVAMVRMATLTYNNFCHKPVQRVAGHCGEYDEEEKTSNG